MASSQSHYQNRASKLRWFLSDPLIDDRLSDLKTTKQYSDKMQFSILEKKNNSHLFPLLDGANSAAAPLIGDRSPDLKTANNISTSCSFLL